MKRTERKIPLCYQTPNTVKERERERKMSLFLLHIFLLEEMWTGYLYGNIIP